MPKEQTTIPITMATNDRIKKLAAARAKKLGLSKPLTQRVYLEMLVTEEEKRINKEQSHEL